MWFSRSVILAILAVIVSGAGAANPHSLSPFVALAHSQLLRGALRHKSTSHSSADGTGIASLTNDTPVPLGERVVRFVRGNFLPGVGKQTVVWSRLPNGTSALRAYERADGRWRCLAEGHHPNIYDLQIGDVDRDGYDDIVLGLIQRSKLDVTEQRRLFVYGVDLVRGFKPKWRGSGLSRPFRGFRLLTEDGGSDIVALEKNTLPEYKDFDWIGIYRWNDFGLRRVWETPIRGRVEDLTTGVDAKGAYIRFRQDLIPAFSKSDAPPLSPFSSERTREPVNTSAFLTLTPLSLRRRGAGGGTARRLIMRPQKTADGGISFITSVVR